MSYSYLFLRKNIQKLQKMVGKKLFHFECCCKSMAFKGMLVLLQKVFERNIIATGLFLIKIPKQTHKFSPALLRYFSTLFKGQWLVIAAD